MKIRMTRYLRASLIRMLKDEITKPNLEQAVDRAYEPLSDDVRKLVELKFPPADMMVLHRYDCADVDDCVKLQLLNGEIDQFRFKMDTGPVVPANYTCRHRVYDLGPQDQAEMITARFMAWRSACENLNDGNNVLWRDYTALINNARYLEEIVEIWPRAAEMMKKEPSTALSLVTPELIERIRQDQEARK